MAKSPVKQKRSTLDDRNSEEKKTDEPNSPTAQDVSDLKPPLDHQDAVVHAPSVLGSFLSIRNLARILLLDLPLLISFALYMGLDTLDKIAEDYLVPQVALQQFTPEKAERDLTYYHRTCHAQDQSAHDTSELLVTPNMTTDDALELMLIHGVSVIPDLLSEPTATELRDFILQENKVKENLIYVIENENRWSFPTLVDHHPSVTAALRELLNNQRLVDILEAVAGPDPAVIEFTAITVAHGAVGQYWHQDVVPEGSPAKYARNFLPSYSLFVPLQNVTAAMGATGICPGTHMCSAGCDQFCPDTGFQVSGRADNWPLGTGALVNQQTTHRGEGHTDPKAPHRVVFILTFAPRPQTAPKTVETRMIGHQGSYSLHWSQWGHTLKDFQNPSLNMQQPWRALRALGLYKPFGKHWGWDYVTVCSGRISNADTGFSFDDLDDFLAAGFWWLPKKLHGSISDTETETGMEWVLFLQDSVRNCLEIFRRAHFGFAFAYVVSILVWFLVWRKRCCRRSVGPTPLAFNVLCIGTLHAIVVVLTWSTRRGVENSSWGRNILGKRSYMIPEPIALAPELPGTLPTEQDILLFEGMQSEHFASYTRVLEFAHPGNKAWNELLARYSTGYDTMSPSLQDHIRISALRETKLEKRLILVKNAGANWAETSFEHAKWLFHKHLLQRSNRFMGRALQHSDFLLSEIRYGYWRNSALQKRFVSKLVIILQDQLLGLQRPQNGDKRLLCDMMPSLFLAKPTFQRHRLSAPPLRRLPASSGIPLYSRRLRDLSVLQFRDASDSSRGDLLREGDMVEATFDGDTSEWYRGHVVQASANRNSWDVEYDDGDEGSLCPTCIRPYVPYAVTDLVGVRLGDEYFYSPGQVIAVHPMDDTLDIKLEDTGEVFEQVEANRLRRVEYETKDTASRVPTSLNVNDRVLAQFPGAGEEWYDGYVAQLNEDGTVAIQYDDGDYAPKVRRKRVELVE